jgi:hypothetical protein
MAIHIAALNYTFEVGGNLAVVVVVIVMTQAIWVVAVFATAELVRKGRRLRSRNATEVLARDFRAPVFMLRSFDDDCLLNPIHQSFHFFSRFGERYEEALARSLSKIGPPISIGLPGTPKLELGSARLYVATPDWQLAVIYFLSRAEVVTIILGHTEGLWWEITQALRRVPLDRLLFFFPYVGEQSKQRSPWRSRGHLLRGGAPAIRNFSAADAERKGRYRLFCDRTQHLFVHTLPTDIGTSQFLTFNRDGTPWLLDTRLPWYSYPLKLPETVLKFDFLPTWRTAIQIGATIRPFIVERCESSAIVDSKETKREGA